MSNKYPGGFVSLGGPVSNSVLFNGSNQYLSIPDNAALEVGSSNFTVEAWIYLTAAIPANGASVINKSNTGSYGPFSIGTASTGYLQFVASTSGSNWEVNLTDATQTIQVGTWYHVAACRSGSNFYLFKNGALVASGSNAGTLINNTETMKIAWVNYASTYFPGFISNVRLVIGTALYTANFAPPTGPLQNITNTALLTCQSSTIVDNSTANSGSGWTITNNNGAIVSATTPFTAYNPNLLDPALGAATPGVWTLSQALSAEVTRSWPMYDPYYKNVILNLHGNGTNAATNNTFVDSSSNAYSLTRGGSLTQGTFTPYGQNYSNYFNGSGDYLYTPSSTPLDLGASDFTIEAWVYVGGLTSYVTSNIISKYSASNTNWMFNLVRTGSTYDALSFYTPSGGATASYAFAFNTWYHVAVTRSGTSMRLYVNGVDIGGATFAITIGSSAEPIRIGEIDYSGYYYYWNGYISNLRLVKGSAVYTSNFTPSTTPLTAISGTSLLTCQSNRFKDNSSNDAVITPAGSASVQRFQPFLFATKSAIGGSAYNPGASSLTTSYSGSVGSTDDFTVEGWFYVTGNTDNGSFVLCAAALGIILTQSGQKLSTYIPSVGFIAWQASALVQNTWHYIVVQRSSSTMSCYLNGTRLGTQAGATGGWTYNGAGLYLTGSSDNRENGYYTDVRISTIARYSGTTMTVPTVPLTADANTTFLLSMANAGVADNAAMSNLATVGDTQISTSVKKYGTGAISFDGTGDWLYAAAGLPNFGTGDFTVEMWVYRNSTASGVLARSGGSTTSGSLGQWMLYFESSSPARMYWMDTVGSSNKWGVSTTSFPTGTWVHVAVVRQSGVWKVFFDGISQASTVGTFTDATSYSNAQLSVGGNFSGYNFNGYIDDLRITNGTARYTANFTPPTSQLQDQ